MNPFANAMTPTHLVLLVVALVFLFGAKRLPEIGRSLGTGMREFKDSISPSSASDAPSPTPEPPTEA